MSNTEIRTPLIYDTTLRDGAQGLGVYFTVSGKLEAAKRLDKLGVHYIEGGWPGAVLTDSEFLKQARDIEFKSAKLVAFGATRHVGVNVEDDPQIKGLIESGTPAVTILAKASLKQVFNVLRTTPEENLDMVADTVSFLKEYRLEVGLDAEHFFDGFKYNPSYTLSVLETAVKAGVDWIALCDTRGGSMMYEIYNTIKSIKDSGKILIPLGIHTHNDCELAVANSLVALDAGVTQLQGTINGYGERTGNANLLTLIANLQLKMGTKVIGDTEINQLTNLSQKFVELTGCSIHPSQAYVGPYAFAHQAGLHADAVLKDPESYEHITPETVGNKRKFALSELGGTASVESRIRDLELPIKVDKAFARQVAGRMKLLESQGFQFERANASFELLVRRTLTNYHRPFELQLLRGGDNLLAVSVVFNHNYKVTESGGNSEYECQLTPLTEDMAGRFYALLKALSVNYPQLGNIHLVSYRTQPINGSGTRVFVELTDGAKNWTTVYTDSDVNSTSWLTLADALEYAILKNPS